MSSDATLASQFPASVRWAVYHMANITAEHNRTCAASIRAPNFSSDLNLEKLKALRGARL